MTGLHTLYLMGAVCFGIAALVWALMRASSRGGAMEAEAEAKAKRAEAAETVTAETVSRVQAGSAAVKAARDQVVAGATPAQVVKANNAKWVKAKVRK